MRIGRLRWCALLAAAIAGGCGGGSPSKSTPVATPAGVPEGTVWAAVSGETGGPVVGARFALGGTTYTSDASGQIKLTRPVPYGTELSIQASGYLERQTLIRRDGAPVFTLWPRTATGWPTEEFVKTLLYTDTAEGSAAGGSPLRRIKRGETHATVLLPQKLFETRHIWEEFDFAVGMMNTAVGGKVVYSLATTRPSSGVVFEVSISEGDSACAGRTLAYAQVRLQGHEITGGKVVFCDDDATRWPGVATHELGHTIGLRHSMSRYALMGAYTYWTTQTMRFTAGEEMSLRLLLDRPAGNRWPDDDRQVTAYGSRVETIVCPLH